MGRIVYSMSVSLDGYVNDAAGSIDWVNVDGELHQAFNDESRACGAFLYGRRMYELMIEFWPFADDPAEPPVIRDFARIWAPMPKYVASTTLREVAYNATLLGADVVGEVARLRDAIEGDIGVGGPTLAAALLRADLVDEMRMYVNPVVLGGGTSFLPRDVRRTWRLADTRRFESGVVMLRHLRP